MFFCFRGGGGGGGAGGGGVFPGTPWLPPPAGPRARRARKTSSVERLKRRCPPGVLLSGTIRRWRAGACSVDRWTPRKLAASCAPIQRSRAAPCPSAGMRASSFDCAGRARVVRFLQDVGAAFQRTPAPDLRRLRRMRAHVGHFATLLDVDGTALRAHLTVQ